MTKKLLAMLAGIGLGVAAAASASAQTADTPWPGQFGPNWMMGQGGNWMMTPMGPAWSGQGGPQGWMMWSPQATRPGGMGGAFYRFAIIDADSDGTISDAEAAANHEEVFVTMDADEDGALTREEYLAVSFGPGPMMTDGRGRLREQALARKAANFAEMDGDGDDSVTQREWMAAGEDRFVASDHDGDGVVTVWEFRSARRF